MLTKMFIRDLILILTLINKVLCQKTDLTFVIDESLSMKDDVEEVRNAVSSILDIALKEKLQIENMVLVTFNDTEARLRINAHSPAELMASLTTVTPINKDCNYECPESVLSGVKLAIESSLIESYIFVFTDASAKDYRKSREIQKLCQEKQIQVVFVLMGDCKEPTRKRFQVYYDIATASSGFAFRVEKNEVDAVYPAISETLKDTRVVLTAVTVTENRTEVPFQINEEYEYVIVFASGINVSLEINGTSSVNKMEKIMWTNHGKVVKLTDPHLGKHVATVRATNSTSVIVAGWTNFYFRYGFSKQVPESMSLEETEKDPLSGTLSHLSLLVSHQKYSLKKPSAQILDINGNATVEVPLLEILPNLYTTLFHVPDDVFTLAITGDVAQTGKPVRRIANTPVIPQKSPNYMAGVGVRYPVYLRENESKTLNCSLAHAETSSIKWFINEVDVGVDGPYLSLEDVHVNDDGNYTCLVDDDLVGSSMETYVVDVGYPPSFKFEQQDPVVIWNPEDYLRCDVSAKPIANVEWTFNGKPLDGINTLQLSNFKVGYYKCIVSNVHGTVERDFIVTPSGS